MHSDVCGQCTAAGDRGLARPPDGIVVSHGPSRERDVGPHLPNIVHSTVMRWAAPPGAGTDAARAAFEAVAAGWEPVVVAVPSIVAVVEDVPYMHVPADGTRVWWSSSSRHQTTSSK